MKLLDTFYKLSKPLAESAGFISKQTGENIELSWSAKAIYTYMLSRNEFFTEKLKGEHFESQATISERCNLDYKTAGKILKMFIEHGVIDAKLVKPKVGQKRYHYYSVDESLDLWVWIFKEEEGKRHHKKDGWKLMGDSAPVLCQSTHVLSEPEADYSDCFIVYEESGLDNSYTEYETCGIF